MLPLFFFLKSSETVKVALKNFVASFFIQDNGIAFWRKLVAEYFAPCAKKRWCLSSYDNVERRAPGVFPQAVMVSDILIFFHPEWVA